MPGIPQPNSPLRAVVFDLDGLMFNTEDLYQEVGATVLARRGHDFSRELLDKIMGRQSDKALQIMIEHHGLSDSVAGLAAESQEILDALLETRLQPMPGLLELLAALERASVPRGIATGSPRSFLDRVLEMSGLRSHFLFTLASEDIEHGKPAPDVYLLAAHKHGCEAEEILVLEDSSIGCQAAVAANTFAVAVPGGHSCDHSFPGAKFIADSLQDERIYHALGLKTFYTLRGHL